MESLRKRTCYSKVTYLPYKTTMSLSPSPKGSRSESTSLTAPPDLWTVNTTTGTTGWTGFPIPTWQQIHTREALYPRAQAVDTDCGDGQKFIAPFLHPQLLIRAWSSKTGPDEDMG